MNIYVVTSVNPARPPNIAETISRLAKRGLTAVPSGGGRIESEEELPERIGPFRLTPLGG